MSAPAIDGRRTQIGYEHHLRFVARARELRAAAGGQKLHRWIVGRQQQNLQANAAAVPVLREGHEAESEVKKSHMRPLSRNHRTDVGQVDVLRILPVAVEIHVAHPADADMDAH